MLHLEFPDVKWKAKININHTIVSLGSCFADQMGEKLKRVKFRSLTNPYGIIFNPISLSKSITNTLERNFDNKKIISVGENYFHWDYHSDIHARTENELQNLILNKTEKTYKLIKDIDWLIVTLGTSWVYKLAESGIIVSNCHKQPQYHFHKKLLSSREVVESLNQVFDKLIALNPELNIILTVSPVRHIKDGLWENNISKGVLHQACFDLCYERRECQYFPAFEIANDVLRDYRFFKNDLIHPTEDAINVIWEYFQGNCFDENTKTFVKGYQSFLRSTNHRPRINDRIEVKKQLEHQHKALSSIRNIKDVSSEIQEVKQKLNRCEG